VQALKWGRGYEQIVFTQYSLETTKLHPNLTLQKTDFCIGQPGYLGVNLDDVRS